MNVIVKIKFISESYEYDTRFKSKYQELLRSKKPPSDKYKNNYDLRSGKRFGLQKKVMHR